jgi:hypothetical protein
MFLPPSIQLFLRLLLEAPLRSLAPDVEAAMVLCGPYLLLISTFIKMCFTQREIVWCDTALCGF